MMSRGVARIGHIDRRMDCTESDRAIEKALTPTRHVKWGQIGGSVAHANATWVQCDRRVFFSKLLLFQWPAT